MDRFYHLFISRYFFSYQPGPGSDHHSLINYFALWHSLVCCSCSGRAPMRSTTSEHRRGMHIVPGKQTRRRTCFFCASARGSLVGRSFGPCRTEGRSGGSWCARSKNPALSSSPLYQWRCFAFRNPCLWHCLNSSCERRVDRHLGFRGRLLQHPWRSLPCDRVTPTSASWFFGFSQSLF